MLQIDIAANSVSQLSYMILIPINNEINLVSLESRYFRVLSHKLSSMWESKIEFYKNSNPKYKIYKHSDYTGETVSFLPNSWNSPKLWEDFYEKNDDREFAPDGTPIMDIDCSHHGTPDIHPDIHQHRLIDTGQGGLVRGAPEPINHCRDFLPERLKKLIDAEITTSFKPKPD